MKQIANNQLVGLGDGFAVFRNLFKKEDGERVSVATTHHFWMEDNKHLTNNQLLEKYKIDQSNA